VTVGRGKERLGKAEGGGVQGKTQHISSRRRRSGGRKGKGPVFQMQKTVHCYFRERKLPRRLSKRWQRKGGRMIKRKKKRTQKREAKRGRGELRDREEKHKDLNHFGNRKPIQSKDSGVCAKF